MLNNVIERTKKTLQKRSLHYRNLVIIISLLLFITPITALISLSWQPLFAWLLIPLAYTLFLYSDQRQLSKWQLTILTDWQQDKLKLQFLAQSLLHLPIFPENTIQSMVALLPQPKESDTLSFESRQAIVCLQKTINHCHRIRNSMLILSMIIIVFSFLLSIILNSFFPLLFIVFIMPLRIIETWYFNQQWQIQLKKNSVFYKKDKVFLAIISHLDCYPLVCLIPTTGK